MAHVFADNELAARLEGLVAQDMRGFIAAARRIDPDGPAEYLDVAGGVAVFFAPGSPANQAVGLGMGGPVADEEIVTIERFFADRYTKPLINTCPLAHPSLGETLGRRGWISGRYENVLIRELDERPIAFGSAGVRVSEAITEEERQLWTLVAAVGFSAPLSPLPEQIMMAEVTSAIPDARLFLAYVGDRPAGTGELSISDDVAWLSADATLEQFRGRGVQHALQARRLDVAREAGCSLAVSEAIPGSVSQRNMERHGFRVAYTRVDHLGPGPGSGESDG